MNSYPSISLPDNIVQESTNMSLEDVKTYFNWFMSVKNERLKLFNNQVFNSSEVELSANRLQGIYYFFKDHLTVKERTSEEIEQERMKLPEELRKIHQIPDYEIVEPTHSIMFDAGIYFGELLRKEVPNTEWSIETDRKMANYGKPVLVKKGMNTDVNPFGVFYVIVLKIQKATIEEDFLFNTYQKSKSKLGGKQKDFLAMVNQWSKGKK